MQASTLQKKKNTISKGKMKKTIKNVLGRPDQLFWPEVTEDEGKTLELALKKHKIDIPNHKKLHWKELKSIPKEKRPKPPKLSKIEGLLFGTNECSTSLSNSECAGIIIEASVNPRTIVQPIIEKCMVKKVPILCLPNLRKNSSSYFGIPTSCLGIKCNCLLDVSDEIIGIAKRYPLPKPSLPQEANNDTTEKMDIADFPVLKDITGEINITKFPFLYRNNKKSRVFIPTSEKIQSKLTTKFIGQDFIEFSEIKQTKLARNAYMKMVMKKISNNPNRAKKK